MSFKQRALNQWTLSASEDNISELAEKFFDHGKVKLVVIVINLKEYFQACVNKNMMRGRLKRSDVTNVSYCQFYK